MKGLFMQKCAEHYVRASTRPEEGIPISTQRLARAKARWLGGKKPQCAGRSGEHSNKAGLGLAGSILPGGGGDDRRDRKSVV